MSPLCGGTGKRKSDCVKFAILALTAKLTQTVAMALRRYRPRTQCQMPKKLANARRLSESQKTTYLWGLLL
jgi:hypothetical protein